MFLLDDSKNRGSDSSFMSKKGVSHNDVPANSTNPSRKTLNQNSDVNSKVQKAKERLVKASKNNNEAHNSLNPVGSLKNADPRSKVADAADEYIHLGRKIGYILTLTWIIITVILTTLLYLPGIIGVAMLILLLVKPQWNYRITVWILEGVLDFFGVGEVLTAINQFGFTKVKIELNFIEKFFIISVIVVYFFGILMLLAFLISIWCWSVGGWGGTLASWLDSTGYIAQLKTICPAQLP
jgi:hypothetical protein